jgi:hypothetical protein
MTEKHNPADCPVPRRFDNEDEMAHQHAHEIWFNHHDDPQAAVDYAKNLLVTILATATQGDMKWVARDIKALASFVAACLDETVVLH